MLLVSKSAFASENNDLTKQNITTVYFDIPETSAGDGLRNFAQATNLALIFPQALVTSMKTNTLRGHFSVEAGLINLLAGTGLKGSIYANSTIFIESSGDDSSALKGSRKTDNMNKTSLKGKVKTNDTDVVVSIPPTKASVAKESELENIVVTGVRGNPRTVIKSPIPIDVFSSEQLEQQGQAGLFESLRFLVPSLNLPQRSGGGTGTFIASAGLRGLNPDQTLVLVNGKRRHKTALINTSTGLFSGSAGVDLNMLPTSAINRIEVLRDGASAQYGSDAIAGVINVILKDKPGTGRAVISSGENFDRSDGENLSVGISNGFALGDDGYINLSYDFIESKLSNRARTLALPEDGGRNLFALLEDGSFDPRESSIDRMVTKNFGNFPQTTNIFGVNAKASLHDTQLYSFASYAHRISDLTFTYRLPSDTRNIIDIFPLGFRPEEQIEESDFEVVAGLTGTSVEYDWDLSVSYGFDDTSWNNTSGVNASLGSGSPTSFFLGNMNSEEMIIQLDATRSLILENSDLQVSFGLQYRREGFEILKGEYLSYADGNNGLEPGAQGYPGFSPEAESNVSRNNINGYIDLAWDVSEKLFLAGALRYEKFNDSAGDEILWKINLRYEISDSVAFRTSINTGFRAPSIQQLGFRGSRGQFTDLDNDGFAEIIVLRQTLPPTDLAAKALGAGPLTPETSVNVSAGISYTPLENTSFTIDFYQIDVDDRIAQSSQFNRGDKRLALSGGTIGNEISALLDEAGIDASLGAVNYFTNAIDTRSRGVDIVATWSPKMVVGNLILSGAYNYNKVEVVNSLDNPQELSGLVLADGSQIEQFDRERLGTYTDAVPDSKLSISTKYGLDKWLINARATRFGRWTVKGTTENLDTDNQAKWIVNLEAGYQLENGLAFFAGANNIFNVYPKERLANSLGTNFYDTYSPYGFTGGSWYIRTSYAW
tara:strand:+ start:2319 stop:5144 length:2826 start_codon:yes stop_codon:yes gene_type:complete